MGNGSIDACVRHPALPPAPPPAEHWVVVDTCLAAPYPYGSFSGFVCLLGEI